MFSKHYQENRNNQSVKPRSSKTTYEGIEAEMRVLTTSELAKICSSTGARSQRAVGTSRVTRNQEVCTPITNNPRMGAKHQASLRTHASRKVGRGILITMALMVVWPVMVQSMKENTVPGAGKQNGTGSNEGSILCPLCGAEIPPAQPIPVHDVQQMQFQNPDFKKLAEKVQANEKRRYETGFAFSKFMPFKHTKGELKQHMCSECNRYIYYDPEDPHKGYKAMISDTQKNIIIGVGALSLGGGLAMYAKALRYTEETIAGQTWGHLFFLVGMFLLAYIIFRGRSWHGGNGEVDTTFKILGAVAFSVGAMCCAGAMMAVNADPTQAHLDEMIAAEEAGKDYVRHIKTDKDIDWSTLFEGGSAIAFGFGIACILFALGFALYVNSPGQKCSWFGTTNKMLTVAGVGGIVAGTAMLGDVWTRMKYATESMQQRLENIGEGTDKMLVQRPEWYGDTDVTQQKALAYVKDDMIGAGSFTALGFCFALGLIWICWLVVRKGVEGGDWRQRVWGAAACTSAGGVGILFACSLYSMHMDDVGKIVGQNVKEHSQVDGYVCLVLACAVMAFLVICIVRANKITCP